MGKGKITLDYLKLHAGEPATDFVIYTISEMWVKYTADLGAMGYGGFKADNNGYAICTKESAQGFRNALINLSDYGAIDDFLPQDNEETSKIINWCNPRYDLMFWS